MDRETHAVPGQRFNALKHGAYAGSILLPGDDAAAFRRERRALFHNYRPQTQDEADLVDAMAEHRWVARRFRPVQARFDGQAVTPETDGAGRVAEPIAHQRLHSGMDVTVHCRRIEKAWHQARAKLLEVQKQRRQGLVAGAVALPQDCYMETDGRVYGPIAPKAIVPLPEPEIEEMEANSIEVGPSADGENGKYREQKEAESAVVPSLEHMDAAAGDTRGIDREAPFPGVSAEARGPAAAGV